jgi:RNA polymerase sigma-70 factor, ECF subfamily
MTAIDRRTSTADQTDEILIASFQQGNEESFNHLVARYKDPLMNFVFRFVGNSDDAADVVQETFVRVYYHRDAYQPIAKFSTWIYTIAANLAKSSLRRRKPGRFLSLFRSDDDHEGAARELPDNRYAADTDAVRALQAERIQSALLKLDETQREIVILCDVQELSYEEICTITGLKIGTVKSRLNRARNRLKILLADMHSEISE